jgi:hypothetical protein
MPDTFNLAALNPANYPVEYSFKPVPSLTVGAAKLVARFAQLLLTLKGSDKTDPAAGCNLLNLVGRFHTSERSYLQVEIERILEDVNYQMLFENDPAVPAEARFVTAELKEIQFNEDSVNLFFNITSETTNSIEFNLPITTWPI